MEMMNEGRPVAEAREFFRLTKRLWRIRINNKEDPMIKRSEKGYFWASVLAVFFFLTTPFLCSAQDLPKGNVVGFLYAKDGTTPLEGAVVRFKNLTSGIVFDSSKSDRFGVFKLQGIEKGVYTYGVVTPQGDFNADNLVGLNVGENETAKLSIALDPYDTGVAEAVDEINQEQEKNGEALVGMIADFNPGTRMAQIQVFKGALQVKDRIHTRGKSTNFYQDIDLLLVGVAKTKRVLKGQTGTLRLDGSAQAGDLVYVVPNKKAFPIFLVPLGLAAIIGGNEAVTYGIMKIKDQREPASAIR
jgi:hypothetical protein